jgi:hypothetical protein
MRFTAGYFLSTIYCARTHIAIFAVYVYKVRLHVFGIPCTNDFVAFSYIKMQYDKRLALEAATCLWAVPQLYPISNTMKENCLLEISLLILIILLMLS